MLAAFVAGAFTLTACQSEPTVVEATPQPKTEPVADNGGGAARPVDPREAHERAELMEAVEGLDFASGQVTVTERMTGDADAVALAIAKGRELIAVNEINDGLRQFAEAVRIDPTLATSYVDLGMALRGKGATDFEIAAFRTAVSTDPELAPARYGLATALWRDGQRDDAITELEQLVEIDADHGKAHERLAIWHYYAGDYETSWNHVHAARRVDQALPPQFIGLLESRMADPG
jgi:tetratricopeptide (TPR) repeat protein